jgi:hypothetical protein
VFTTRCVAKEAVAELWLDVYEVVEELFFEKAEEDAEEDASGTVTLRWPSTTT